MCMCQLIFQDCQQVANDTQSLRKKGDALVHLEIAAYGCVNGLELRLRPHELRRIQHGAL